MDKFNFLKMVDHTILKADATKDKVDKILEFAKTNNTASVCINPYYVKYASEFLRGNILVTSFVSALLTSSSSRIF